MDGGAWWAAVHGVTKSRTRLRSFTFTFHFHAFGEGNGNPLQCSCLENPRDGGAWWAAVYGVAQSRTQLKRLSSSSSINQFSLLCFPTIFQKGTLSLMGSYFFPNFPKNSYQKKNGERTEAKIQANQLPALLFFLKPGILVLEPRLEINSHVASSGTKRRESF